MFQLGLFGRDTVHRQQAGDVRLCASPYFGPSSPDIGTSGKERDRQVVVK